MSVLLTQVKGRPAVEIEDHKGRVFRYLVQVTVDTADAWAVLLTKLDPGGEVAEAYEVSCRAGVWDCQCKDFEFRFRRNRSRLAGAVCKHGEHARDLRAALAALKGVTA